MEIRAGLHIYRDIIGPSCIFRGAVSAMAVEYGEYHLNYRRSTIPASAWWSALANPSAA